MHESNFFPQESGESPKVNVWSEKVAHLKKKGILSENFNHPSSEIDVLSLSPDVVKALEKINIINSTSTLDLLADANSAVGNNLRSGLGNSQLVQDIENYQKHLHAVDDWWNLSGDRKKAVLNSLGLNSLPSGFLSKLAFKTGVQSEEDWLDAAFLHAITELTARAKPAVEALTKNVKEN